MLSGLAEAVENDIRPGGSQCASDAQADTARGARHQRHAPARAFLAAIVSDLMAMFMARSLLLRAEIPWFVLTPPLGGVDVARPMLIG